MDAREKEKQMKLKSDRFLKRILLLAICGYVFFFSSNLWMPKSYEGVEVAPIGEPISANERNITLDSWTYSKEQKLMEIIISIENLGLDGIEKYDWEVRDKNSRIQSEVVIEDEDFIVIQARAKNGWTEVVVEMDIPLSVREQNKELKFDPVKLYMSDKEVKWVKQITRLDRAGYMEAAREGKVEAWNKQIEKLNRKNRDLKKQMEIAEERISALTETLEHQVESEKDETMNNLSGLEVQLEELKEQVFENEKIQKELMEKIEYAEESK